MEEILYPGEGAILVEVGVNYRDYLLSDIINNDTRHLEYVSLLSRDNEAIITARLYDNSNSVFLRLMPERGKIISGDLIAAVGRILGDAVIRYFNDLEEPYVVSLVSYNKREFIELSDFE